MQFDSNRFELRSSGGSESPSWDAAITVNPLSNLPAPELSDYLLMKLLTTTSDSVTTNRLFEIVFNRYHERVRMWCFKVTKSQDRMLDLTQEVFFKAFRSIHTFRGDSQLSTWLYAITRNHCLNALKKWKTEPYDYSKEPRLDRLIAPDESVHADLERAQGEKGHQ